MPARDRALIYIAAAAAGFLLFSAGWLASEYLQGDGYSVAVERYSMVADSGNKPLEIPTVNINTATADELQQLPGIGVTRAAAIVTHREKVGGFMSTADIMEVSGIGEGIYNRLRDYITIDD